jgi:MFS-type transporter involved in bile tolerance (Atg22 family)
MVKHRPSHAGCDVYAGSSRRMNLMLVAIFASIGLGLLARRLGGRENLALACIAVVVTALYCIFPWRFT